MISNCKTEFHRFLLNIVIGNVENHKFENPHMSCINEKVSIVIRKREGDHQRIIVYTRIS